MMRRRINSGEIMSRKFDLDGMSVDEMWQLYEEISQVLSARLASEKLVLEKRLAQLRRDGEMPSVTANSSTSFPRRKYPKVFPKYRNPNEPSQTWSGRGKKPRWLAAALKRGHRIEEFVITDDVMTKSPLEPSRAR
jgi:DNA-binding protein H-NS